MTDPKKGPDGASNEPKPGFEPTISDNGATPQDNHGAAVPGLPGDTQVTSTTASSVPPVETDAEKKERERLADKDRALANLDAARKKQEKEDADNPLPGRWKKLLRSIFPAKPLKGSSGATQSNKPASGIGFLLTTLAFVAIVAFIGWRFGGDVMDVGTKAYTATSTWFASFGEKKQIAAKGPPDNASTALGEDSGAQDLLKKLMDEQKVKDDKDRAAKKAERERLAAEVEKKRLAQEAAKAKPVAGAQAPVAAASAPKPPPAPMSATAEASKDKSPAKVQASQTQVPKPDGKLKATTATVGGTAPRTVPAASAPTTATPTSNPGTVVAKVDEPYKWKEVGTDNCLPTGGCTLAWALAQTKWPKIVHDNFVTEMKKHGAVNNYTMKNGWRGWMTWGKTSPKFKPDVVADWPADQSEQASLLWSQDYDGMKYFLVRVNKCQNWGGWTEAIPKSNPGTTPTALAATALAQASDVEKEKYAYLGVIPIVACP